MASFSQNELSWGRLLSNLGYKDKEKYLNNRDLFVVPNKDAFQKVGLFIGLLIIFDMDDPIFSYGFFEYYRLFTSYSSNWIKIRQKMFFEIVGQSLTRKWKRISDEFVLRGIKNFRYICNIFF